jgi:DNA primase
LNQDLENLKLRVLRRADLKEIIGQSVQLTIRSGRPLGLCPFHQEKTPSFYIYDDHYFCFGCKASGDAISFVRETQGLGFIDALKFLADKFGIDAKELSQGAKGPRFIKEANLFKMMQEANHFFIDKLNTSQGESSRNYLLGRGFSTEDLNECGFGLTPEEPYGLCRHLKARGFSEQQMISCSLATQSSKDNRIYDFFRSRITIPIQDNSGRVVGFGGRTANNNPAKYINSRESLIFEKSKILFGIHKARQFMKKAQRSILVEGYMDALMLRRSGFAETVACMGTSLTEHQLKLLSQVTGTVYLVFDGDHAGQQATLASVTAALNFPELRIMACPLPEGEDPDSYIVAHGEEGFRTLLKGSQDLLDFAIASKLRSTHSLATPDLLKRELVPWLSQVSDRIQRGFLTSKVSQLTGIPKEQIEQQLGSAYRNIAPKRSFDRASDKKTDVVEARSEFFTLSPMQFEWLGHLFYSNSFELNFPEIYKFSCGDLELPPLAAHFLQEVLDFLKEKKKPQDLAANEFPSSRNLGVMTLLNKIKGAKGAFAEADTSTALAKIKMLIRHQKLRDTIKSMKAKVARLAGQSQPGVANQEMEQLLGLIMQFNQVLNENHSGAVPPNHP